MTLYNALTILHVIAGGTALGTALSAILAKAFGMNHRVHVISGRLYVGAMVAVALTSFPMAVIRPNSFLFMIGIFSLYLTLAGFRYATNRKGTPRWFDRLGAGLMLLTAAIMIGLALYGFMNEGNGEILLLIFGLIAALLGGADLKRMRTGGRKGKTRIAAHLTMMLSATIATLTAFLVNNVVTRPAIIPWIAPTILIVPIIVLWNRKVLKGKTGTTGLPDSLS